MPDRHELRCPAKLHGVVTGPTSLEVKCNSRFCGAGQGVVVLHTFDTVTGMVTGTRKFSDPLRDSTGRNTSGNH